MTIEVTGLGITPVKATRLHPVRSVQLDRHGIRENRRFFLIDAKNQMVNAKRLGALQTIIGEYDDVERRLRLSFPDGRVVEGDVTHDEEVVTLFYGEPMSAKIVRGAWSEAISQHVGKRLRLVEAGDGGAVDRGSIGATTLISRASLRRLAEQANLPSIDPRRFRMLIEIDGIGAHEEDGWVGRTIQVGEAVLRGRGHVGRCVITSRDPETGEATLPTLKLLGGYRRHLATTEPIAFGIHAEIVKPGRISVGDGVEVDD